jgi:polar amino acid transport system substrate-binding protein
MKNHWINLSLAFVLLMHLASTQAETLSIVAEHWPPYVDESAPQQGLAIDLITTALIRARYDYKIDYQAWPRALEGGKIGVYDMIANIWHSDERALDLDYSEPYLINDMRLIKRKGSPIKFKKMADLNNLVVGVEKDYAYPQEFAAANNFTKVSNSALLPALAELLKGKYDAVIGDLNAINYVLLTFLPTESNDLEILPKSVGMSKLYVAVSKTNPKHRAIIKDFNEALQSMKQDGTYQTIIQAHQQRLP